MRFPLVVRLDVPHISRMPLLRFRQAMLMTLGIIMAARAHPIRSRAIPVLMDMKRVLLARHKSLKVRDNLH